MTGQPTFSCSALFNVFPEVCTDTVTEHVPKATALTVFPDRRHTPRDAAATLNQMREWAVALRPAFLTRTVDEIDLPLATSIRAALPDDGCDALWLKAALIVGVEWVKPVAVNFIHPLFSLTLVTTVEAPVSVSTTSMVAVIGAEVNL